MKKLLIIAFGSQVSGKTTVMSDFDFGVLGEKPLSLSERTDLSGYISSRLGINEDKIDLIDLNTASPLLKFEVARNGKLIDGEHFAFIRFKVRAFKEFVDTAKFRRMREKVMLKNYA
ncbi:MAG: nucleotidyltransferase domain-containing protein [Candidatus Paceibacterota bacterium]|jgi:predicted nucleotidyltransferase